MKSGTITAIKKSLVLIFAAALLCAVSGCGSQRFSSFREIENLQLVQTLGIDVKNDLFSVTVSTGAPLEGQPSVIISRPAGSISLGEESIQDYSFKEDLYFSHTRYVVLGEEAAKNHAPDIIDYIARGTRLRTDVPMFLVKNGTATNLISQSGSENSDITESLSSVERDIKNRGLSYAFSCREIIRRMTEYGSALICAVSPAQTDGSIFTDTGTLASIPAGYGILRDGLLVGYLDREQSWGANLLMGKSGHGTIALKLDKQNSVIVFTETGSTAFTASWSPEGNLDKIHVEVDISGTITRIGAPTEDSQTQFLEKVSSALEDETKKRCQEALSTAAELDSDFLGLMGILRKDYPKEILSLNGGFASAMSKAEIEVTVKASILRSFDLDGVSQVLEEDTK